MEHFRKFALSAAQQAVLKGGGACQNLNNCYASRDGACQYSNNYGQCMYNQAVHCDGTFLEACAIE